MRWIPVYPGISRIVFLFATCGPRMRDNPAGRIIALYDPAARARRPDLSPIVDTPRNTPYFNDLWVANYYSARNPLRLSSLVILGVVARMFRCATRSSCWCT